MKYKLWILLIILVCHLFLNLFFNNTLNPKPIVYDEFAYLLQAETFLEKRISNPTIKTELTPSFEAAGLNLIDSYVSKYPPIQSICLALGSYFFNHYLAFIWIISSLCLILTYLIAKTISSNSIAIITTILVASNSKILVEWNNSYWGGTIYLFAALLLLYCFLLLKQKKSFLILSGIATASLILALGRPYEGFIFSLLAYLYSFWRQGFEWHRKYVARYLMPIFLIVLSTTAFYNYKTTQSLATLPHYQHQETYGSVPPFFGQDYQAGRNSFLNKIYYQEFSAYQEKTKETLSLVKFLANKIKIYSTIYYSEYLLIIFLLLGVFYRYKLFLIAIYGISLASLLIVRPTMSHYFATHSVWLILLFIEQLKLILSFSHTKKFVAITAITLIAITHSMSSYDTSLNKVKRKNTYLITQKDTIVEEVSRKGKAIIFVEHEGEPLVSQDWVYNSPNIDSQAVIWARKMNSTQNDILCNAYADRSFWTMSISKNKYKIKPYNC